MDGIRDREAIQFYCPCKRGWTYKDLSFNEAKEGGLPKCTFCSRLMNVERTSIGLREVLMLRVMPDLLEACQALVQADKIYEECGGDTYDWDAAQGEAIEKAEQAIKKATILLEGEKL